MFRKVLIFAMFATAAGYCFAEAKLPQIATSDVFYSREKDSFDDEYRFENNEVVQNEEYVVDVVPAWPIAGSDADVGVNCDEKEPVRDDKIHIVSKINDDMVVDNAFDFGGRFAGWSGGANMQKGNVIPAGFDDDCDNNAEMPLLHREMLEDDGGSVLSVSRSGRKKCDRYSDGYANYMTRYSDKGATSSVVEQGNFYNGQDFDAEQSKMMMTSVADEVLNEIEEMTDNVNVAMNDGVRSWVVASGQTLREVLQNWCDQEGWDLVWATSREYPIEASAMFKGRFTDVASALVRNFSRATPIPYAKFYKGNMVLVVSTNEE
ncbi:MAG: toxin co-regulated pilus biosynthesis Q family protein [Alphaproteobacteria bacterium]